MESQSQPCKWISLGAGRCWGDRHCAKDDNEETSAVPLPEPQSRCHDLTPGARGPLPALTKECLCRTGLCPGRGAAWVPHGPRGAKRSRELPAPPSGPTGCHRLLSEILSGEAEGENSSDYAGGRMGLPASEAACWEVPVL